MCQYLLSIHVFAIIFDLYLYRRKYFTGFIASTPNNDGYESALSCRKTDEKHY